MQIRIKRKMNNWAILGKLKISRNIRNEIEALTKKEIFNADIFLGSAGKINKSKINFIVNKVKGKVKGVSPDVIEHIIRESIEKNEDGGWRWSFQSGMFIMNTIDEIDPGFFTSFRNAYPNIKRFLNFSSKEKIEAEEYLVFNKVHLYYL